ncbi:sulfate adenylyltransferase subunit CysN [Bosea caraganae]|uniref:Sulfate adenylyltransferase subunit 1 n=1 Tax=Bosea caraganae TaxID=2763117 RepID=A0A370L1P0_9HYPH|nr:sulfate adenylyltransferase subunit CysN [Bosea caraganae]RDJ21457.1 sulfate adenylyltransferase subunit CysN [Bosea caraganae]RDJ23425.1 sulfate adenylyltransferase subunit CysN [Bosea caraganae]
MGLAVEKKRPSAAAPLPANDASGLTGVGQQSLLRFITCGSVDDGKSTLIGRMLYEAGAVFDDQLSALDSDSKKFGTQGAAPDFALLVDGLSAEREQGITIDVAYRYFATEKRSFIVADTPGHEQYTRNMATGASTADLAIILIDARKGLLPQTRRHSFIVSLVGVRHVVVAVNKMDLVGYDEAVFQRIAADYREAVKSLGFASVHFIPVSARDGENVMRPSKAMPWHDGPALLPFLETVAVAEAARGEDGFALPVQWVNRPDLDFRGYAGTPVRGRIRVGDPVTVLPSGRQSKVARVIGAAGDTSNAAAGQAVTLTLTEEIDISRGDLLVATDAPLPVRRELKAKLLWTGERAMLEGGQFALKLGTQAVNATVETLHHSIDIEGFKPVPAQSLLMNGIGLATLRFDRPLVALPYDDSRELGGFILFDRISNETVAFGFVAAEARPGRDEPLPEEGALGRARQAAIRLVGRRGTPERRLWWSTVSWRVLSTAGLFAAAFALTGRADLSGALALGDIALRPSLRALHAHLWRKHPSATLRDGAGI